MTKEFLQEKSLEEVAKQFDTELAEYVKKVNEVNSQEELTEMEKEINAENDEVQKYIREVAYKLPTGVTFDGEERKLARIAGDIIYFLNKKEVEWRYTNGLYELVKFWQRNNPDIITYGAYDSTLRLLNQVSYKGFKEWKDILFINEYLKSAHELYSKDTSWMIFVSEKHNAILDRMKQLSDLANELGEGKQENNPAEPQIVEMPKKK